MDAFLKIWRRNRKIKNTVDAIIRKELIVVIVLKLIKKRGSLPEKNLFKPPPYFLYIISQKNIYKNILIFNISPCIRLLHLPACCNLQPFDPVFFLGGCSEGYIHFFH